MLKKVRVAKGRMFRSTVLNKKIFRDYPQDKDFLEIILRIKILESIFSIKLFRDYLQDKVV